MKSVVSSTRLSTTSPPHPVTRRLILPSPRPTTFTTKSTRWSPVGPLSPSSSPQSTLFSRPLSGSPGVLQVPTSYDGFPRALRPFPLSYTNHLRLPPQSEICFNIESDTGSSPSPILVSVPSQNRPETDPNKNTSDILDPLQLVERTTSSDWGRVDVRVWVQTDKCLNPWSSVWDPTRLTSIVSKERKNPFGEGTVETYMVISRRL